ncbi:phosphotransferase [Streptomyces sp. SID13726]|uniref:phosphotransferase n=1 Tax=Streptomyces sp. SID13726 TaxID=2706058 RepID=UPI0013BE6607|nr:phosphotransferase [Streptomyces sp. SID13726]NEB01173.1 phosphotransferase [Streptomyces sp. SID13726]
MQTGELLGSGRSADVFAIDDHWVLRRYRDGGDAVAEAVVMAHVAGHGYPVPRVRDLAGPAPGSWPRTDLVIQRLRGPSMLEALRQGATTAAEAGATLAELLHRLHRVPARVSTRPGHRVLHLDLHPDNVMLTPDGPMVIDWRNTEEGPPGLDWGMSALILAQVAVGTEAEAPAARAVLAALLRHLGPAVDLGNTGTGCLAAARQRRAADPAVSEGEAHLLDDAVRLVLELGPA